MCSRRIPEVLIVEDDTVLAGAVADVMRLAGYAVTVRGDASNAQFALLNGHGFDLVLCDLELGEQNGAIVAQTVRDLPSKPPVVAMTGHRVSPEKLSAIGFAALLRKPFDNGELVALANRMVGRSAA